MRFFSSNSVQPGCHAVQGYTVLLPKSKQELDRSKPDGTPRKLLDVSRLSALGWKARIGLEEGIRSTYQWYCANS